MNIYTAKEKDDLLCKIIAEDYLLIIDEREISIVDSLLKPMGLVKDVIMLDLPVSCRCLVTQKGVDFLKAGGFNALEKEEKEEEDKNSRMESLIAENLQFQNDEFKYKEKIRRQETIIRRQKYIEFILAVLLAITNLFFAFFKS